MVNRFTLFVLLLLFAGKILPQDNNKILFLDFKFIKGEPQLVGMQVVKGALKVKKRHSLQIEGLRLTLLSMEKVTLFTDMIDDPTEGIYEYPLGEGKIGRIVVPKDTVVCTVRVPYSTEIFKIIIHRNNSSNTLLKSSAGSPRSEYEFRIDHSKILNRK